jgi:hypothetical protein
MFRSIWTWLVQLIHDWANELLSWLTIYGSFIAACLICGHRFGATFGLAHFACTMAFVSSRHSLVDRMGESWVTRRNNYRLDFTA